MLQVDPEDRRKLIDPLFSTGWRFWLVVGTLLMVIGWGLVMYVHQVQFGLGETGMRRPVYWGMYMVNFIFFIGISHAGTLISAILRVTGAEWRRPITRIAEAITAFALIVGTLQIIIDMGRPDRLISLLFYGRLQSPILWDVVSVTAYFTGSMMYLYLPLIPDAAILRDNMPPDAPRWRHILYRILALGWRGNKEQWRRLEKAIARMAIFIIPVAVSVHTIISWILATTTQPGWHSTIFGPYFVVGAIFSGIGALFIAMTAMRKIFGLEGYIKLRQYRSLGLLFITMSIFWAYFTYAENMTIAAGQQLDEFPVLASKLWGTYSTSFWIMTLMMVVAFVVLALPLLAPATAKKIGQARFLGSLVVVALAIIVLFLLIGSQRSASVTAAPETQLLGWALLAFVAVGIAVGFGQWLRGHLVAATIVAAVAVLAGMWLERWILIVPTVTHPHLIPYSTYTPTLTEISLTAASISLFILLFVVFFKLFPAISIWEIAEGRVVESAHEQVSIPVPEPSATDQRKRRWVFRQSARIK